MCPIATSLSEYLRSEASGKPTCGAPLPMKARSSSRWHEQRVLFEELVELAWEKARSRGEAWGQGGEGG